MMLPADEILDFKDGVYRTREHRIFLLKNKFPDLFLYPKIIKIIAQASRKAKRAKYDYQEWSKSSLAILRALENVGVKFDVKGLDNFKNEKGPFVFIANHISVLETFCLPVMITLSHPMTFIVKESLLRFPVFRHVMASREPIVVSRKNARQDLVAVLEQGVQKIEQGLSITVFPQSTRSVDFKPEEFNSIGIKLAKRAGVPVIPIALKTDAWGNGKLLKDFGKVDSSKIAHFQFGEPMEIKTRGAEEHGEIIRFIEANLAMWQS